MTIATNVVLVGALCTLSGAPDRHSLEFWRSIVQHDYAVPEGADIGALRLELGEMIASPDPEPRDEIGYSTLVAWIYRKRIVGPETLRVLTHRWLGNLTKGIGERDTDRVFRSPIVFGACPVGDRWP